MKTQFILLLFLFSFPISILAQSTTSQEMGETLFVLDKLGTLEFQKKYFDLFPDSFEEFTDTFAYKDGVQPPIGNPREHIQAFFNRLTDISERKMMEKCIAISIGGHWDADAVNYFQNDLRPLVFENIDLNYEILKTYSDEETQSFFYFFFDGIHPEFKTVPEQFEKFKNLDKKFYILLSNAHQKVLEDRKH